MKAVEFGKEIQNNKHTRYALIIMKLDRKTKDSLDHTITYVYDNDLDYLLKLRTSLNEVSIDKPHYLQLDLYDYKENHYIK